MDKFPIRVLVVEDYESWRRYLSTTLRKQRLQVIGEVSDGLEAVQKAEELQPELILLDIGLPTLSGIEAARRIRQVSPGSKILFVSENRSVDIAEEALSTGAGGYVVKSDAAAELLPAVKTVLEGKRFVSASLADHVLDGPPNLFQLREMGEIMATKKRIEVFSAGCAVCKKTIEMVKRIAGSSHEVVVHDVHRPEIASRAKQHGIRSVPAVVIDGKLAGCCAGRGPDEHVLRAALE